MEVICPETSVSHQLPLGERLPSPRKAAPVQARTWQRDNPAAAREGAPSASPTAGAGLEATELEGNVALIYTRLLSLSKTIAIYETS